MIWVDKLSERIAKYVVNKNDNLVVEEDAKIEGIAQEIDILRELKAEIVSKDKEIYRQMIEWDKTFDSIGDNICIIDADLNIAKVNKSLITCIREQGGPWDNLIGMPWMDFKDDMGLPSEICVVNECLETGKSADAIIDMGHGTFSVVANPIIDVDTDEVVGVVRISRDVTKTELLAEKLKRRSNIYHAISEMSKTLVNHEDWREAMGLVLHGLGESIGASRVYIFRNVNRDSRICSLLEHCYHNDDERNCTAEVLTECLNYDEMPEWENQMRLGNSMTGNLVDCQICPLKERCSCVEEVVVSAVPIFVEGEWWGFIGFDYMNGTRKWKDEDETLLRIAADILGGVIFHRGRYWEVVTSLEGCEDELEREI